MKIKYIYIIIYFCLLLQPYFLFLGQSFSLFYLFFLSPIIIVLLNISVPRYIVNYFVLSSALSVVCLLVGFINDGNISDRVILLLNVYFFILCTTFVFFRLANKYWNPSFEEVLILIMNVITFNSVFIILLNTSIISPDVFYNIIHVDPKVFTYPIKRYPGFIYDSFSYASLFCAYGVIIACYLYYVRKKISNSYFYLVILILMVSALFSGRTGLLVGLITILIFNFRLGIKSFFSLLIFVILGVGFMSSELGSYEWIKGWALGFLLKIFSGGSISNADSSIGGVHGMMFFPENIIFGSGEKFIEVPSDLGIVRFVNSMGFFGICVFLSFYIFHVVYFLSKRCYICLFFVALLMFLNIKDIYFVSPYAHFFILSTLLVSSLNYKKGSQHV